MDFVSKAENLIRRYPFSHHGFARLERPLTFAIYRDWIERGDHGQMKYLAEHMDTKEHPETLLPDARAVCAVVVARSYLPHPFPHPSPLDSSRLALYAQGEDYHLHFKRELDDLARDLKNEWPNQQFVAFTDSAPIMERDLAYRAGLGWFGKNTCLIHPQKGSLFFLGQILTTMDFEPLAMPVADFCGTCDRCIRACPTGALEIGKRLNANKCIAYWTIETRAAPPADLRDKFQDWLFGCDICQTVCPWNEKVHGRALMQDKAREGRPAVEDLRWLLTRSNKAIARELANSPLSRARPAGLKGNAILLIGKYRLHELRAEVENAAADPQLNEIASWALGQLG